MTSPNTARPSRTDRTSADGAGARALRILIAGCRGAGKSDLAKKLEGITGIERLELDKEVSRIGRPFSHAGSLHIAAVLARPQWIIEGRWCQVSDEMLNAATLVIHLDLKIVLTWWRSLRRGIKQALRREMECTYHRITLGWVLFHHRLFLDKVVKEKHDNRNVLSKQLIWIPHVRLCSQREVEKWLASWWRSNPPPENGKARIAKQTQVNEKPARASRRRSPRKISNGAPKANGARRRCSTNRGR